MIRSHKQIIVLTGLTIILLTVACGSDSDRAALVEQHKMLAGELRDSKLYAAAVEEYQKVLEYPGLDNRTRANVNYLIAQVYFDNIKDYERAASYYVRARSIDPEGSFMVDASKNLVASLERMGHYVDARRELSAAVDVDAPSPKTGDVAVAKIGERSIWLSEIDEEIQALPAQVQKQLMVPAEKEKFVRQYIGLELIYRAAVSQNYDNDPKIIEQQNRLRRQLLIDKYLVENVMPQVKVDTMDVRNFYAANKDTRYDGQPYDSVRAQVFIDYESEKAGQAFQDYITRLAEAEKVEFYESNIK